MKIAIATESNRVSSHFGRCPEYTIVNIENGKILNCIKIPNPGHEPGFLPEYLSTLGVGCIIAGGMGYRAQNLFSNYSIKTYVGIEGTIDEIVRKFMEGKLESSESFCDHSTEGRCHD